MWKDRTREHYFWAGIGNDFDELVKELMDIEVDEEADLFRLGMHVRSEEDLDVFEPVDREELLQLFSELIKDTERHSRTLRRVVKVLKAYRARHLQEP